MTELMQTLFDYLSEKRIVAFLPGPCGGSVEERENALVDTLSPSQKQLWDQWREAEMEYRILYEQALFQASLAMAKELS